MNDGEFRHVGFIGLGVMGVPMATNLLRSGYALTVHDLDATRAEPLIELGATWAEDAASVARGSDVVITIVPDSPDVVAAAEGPAGLLAGGHPHLVWIDMSTISPVTAQQLAEAAAACGIEMLDAPVSGGQKGAIEATLSIMVGGPSPVLERCIPLLQCMGTTIVHIGERVGAGQVAKACNQMVVGVTIGVVAEALTVGAKAGVDPAKIRSALLGGFAQSRVLDLHGQRMLDRAFEPGFRIHLHQKDMAIATSMARAYGAAVPLSALTLELMNALAASGQAGSDHSALVQVYERLAEHCISPTSEPRALLHADGDRDG
jgi:2-hydroxy-3-oxopropionate reductase